MEIYPQYCIVLRDLDKVDNGQQKMYAYKLSFYALFSSQKNVSTILIFYSVNKWGIL